VRGSHLRTQAGFGAHLLRIEQRRALWFALSLLSVADTSPGYDQDCRQERRTSGSRTGTEQGRIRVPWVHTGRADDQGGQMEPEDADIGHRHRPARGQPFPNTDMARMGKLAQAAMEKVRATI